MRPYKVKNGKYCHIKLSIKENGQKQKILTYVPHINPEANETHMCLCVRTHTHTHQINYSKKNYLSHLKTSGCEVLLPHSQQLEKPGTGRQDSDDLSEEVTLNPSSSPVWRSAS